MKDFEVLGVRESIYHLGTGLVIYSEDVKEDGEFLIFDMRNSVVLTRVMGPHGEQGITAEKGTESAGSMWASRLKVRKDWVVGMQDTVNDRLMMNIRQALSGLVIAKPGR